MTQPTRDDPRRQQAAALYIQGATIKEIAHQMNITPGGTGAMLHQVRKRQGLACRYRKWPPADILRVHALRKQGWKREQIATEFDESVTTISGILYRPGIKDRVDKLLRAAERRSESR